MADRDTRARRLEIVNRLLDHLWTQVDGDPNSIMTQAAPLLALTQLKVLVLNTPIDEDQVESVGKFEAMKHGNR